MREKMSKQPHPAPTASAAGPCPTIIQISRTPRRWKITQHFRTTRPPPSKLKMKLLPFLFHYKTVSATGLGGREIFQLAQ